MKKLYFLLVMLLSVVGVTTMQAQEEVTIPVNMNYGKWISWNGNESNPWARTWFSSTTPAISICTATGAQSSANYVEDIRGKQFYAANNMSVWGDARTDLMFFTRFGSADAPYEITVADGWYLTAVEFDFDCANNVNQTDGSIELSIDNGEGVVSTDMGDTQHVSWTNDDDEIYSVQFTPRRIEGTYNFARTSNFFVTVKKQPEAKAALMEMQSTLEKYADYHFVADGQPGNYGKAEYEAFRAAIDEAHEADGNPDLASMSDDELATLYRRLSENIKVTYEAVLASRNMTYPIADGYYRIKSALEFYTTKTIIDEETQEETTVTTYVDKYITSYMEGSNFQAIWETPDDLEANCTSLWKITNKDGYLDIVNMGLDTRFVKQLNYAYVNMSLTSEDLMQILPAITADGTTYVNIRVAPQEGDKYQYEDLYYYHAYGHSSGAGTNGRICTYYTSSEANENDEPVIGASEWVLVPVDSETAEKMIADYEPIKNQTLMKERYKIMLADAKDKLAIAKDIVVTIDNENPLITDNSQFSSPSTEPSEGSLNNLLDGDASTFWHSAWSSGNVANGTHYLQVELTDDALAIANAAIQITRRPVTNDHVTLWGVYGTNEAEAEKDACESLGQLSTPYGNNTETIVSDVFPIKGYKYLRFYIDGTTTGRGFGHVSEFQIYPADVYQSETSQYNILGDVAKNLDNVLTEQKDLEIEDLTEEEYNALKAAYDAFIAVFVDPTALRESLANLKDVTKIIVVGDQPGFWSTEDGAGAFKTLYDEAVAYDAAGAYTAEQTQKYIDTLAQQSADIYGSANQIQTGKWYRIRFATEEEFEKYEWDKVAGNGQFNETLGKYTSEPLFGKYLTVSNVESENETYINDEGNEASATIYKTEESPEAADFGLNDNVVLDDKDDIQGGENLDLFRFIMVGDSAYIMQNKGTNLFLKAAGTSGYVTLSVHPSLFNVRAIGYGENVIAAKSITGNSQNYLHGQVAANMLVTWDASTPGSRSGFYIEEAEDVAGDYEGTEFNVPVVYGALNTFCYPVGLTASEGQMWSVSSVDAENNSISLVKIEKADAGRPFIYINGEIGEYNAEEEAEMVKFAHDYTIGATEPQTSAPLKGTFETVKIDRGDVYASGNKLVVNTVGKDDIMVTYTYVGANHAYISTDPALTPNAEINVIWDENGEDAIQTALQNVSRSGAVYTVDGRLVSKKATLNDLQKFGKGLYILNGTKVVVK